jgi:hypothetical protein
VVFDHATMTIDALSREYACDALDELSDIPGKLQPVAAFGYMHGGIALIADCLGHGIATEIMRDLQRELDRWRDENQIDA